MRGGTFTLAQLIDSIPRQYTGAKPSEGAVNLMAFDGPYKINLEVNRAIRGTLKDIYYLPERQDDIGKTWDAQWEMKGNWEMLGPDGEWSAPQLTRVFVNVPQLETGPVELGLITQNGEKTDKKTGQVVPAYVVHYRGQLRISKQQEKGSKRHIVTLSRVGEPAAPQAATTGLPPAPAQRASVVFAHAASAAATLPADTDEWAALEARLLRSKQIACRIWGADYDPRALVAFTATAFIAADRHNLPGAKVMVPQVHIPGPSRQTVVSHVPATDAQVSELRALLNTEAVYGGGPLFTPAERMEWLAKCGTATVVSLGQDILRLKKMVAQRQPVDQGAGPGKPGSLADFPEALEPEEDALPF